MKKVFSLLAVLLLLSGCGNPGRDPLPDQLFQEPEYLSGSEDCQFTFSQENMEEKYLTILVPLNTETGQLQIRNLGDSEISCDLFVAPDYNTSAMNCTIQTGELGRFQNLCAQQFYYVGVKPTGDCVDVVIED